MEMSFNNFVVSQLFGIREVTINVLPSVSVSSKQVPSRHGTIFQGATIGEREITVDIYLLQDYEHQFDEEGIPKSSVFNNYVRSIAYYLQTDEPKQLIFSDEPDRYYNAICTGIEMQRLFKYGEGTITFTCNDPYIYATKENVFIQDEATGKYLVDNFGTVESYPNVTVQFHEDATFLGVVTPESVVQIGSMAGEDDTTNKTYKYVDGLKTLNNWQYGGQALMLPDCQYDDSISVTCTGEVMKPSLVKYEEGDAPTGNYTYKGTQMVTVLDTKYRTKYFDTRLQFDFSSGGNEATRKPSQMGRIEIELLDINNNIIARCGMMDTYKITECNVPYISIGKEQVWKEVATQPTPTTKRYVKAFDNEEDLPSDATLIDKYEKTVSYATITVTGSSLSVYNTYKTGRKIKTTIKNKQGVEYRVKTYNEEKYGNWIEIYLNSACTSSGWVYKTSVTYNEPATSTMYVYERKIYPDKNIGKYCDFWGYFKIARKPYGTKGDSWELSLYRLKTVNGKEQATKLYSKKFTDTTGTKYTSAGNIAKVAVSFLSRTTNEPISKISFNHLEVQTINGFDENENEPHIIATEGDKIEIDYSIPTVYLNGEEILEEVDIGSRFAPLQPFMRSEVEIVSDALVTAEIKLRDRFL